MRAEIGDHAKHKGTLGQHRGDDGIERYDDDENEDTRQHEANQRMDIVRGMINKAPLRNTASPCQPQSNAGEC